MTRAESSAVRAIGPSLTIVQANAIAPVRGTKPNVGRKPVAPHRVEGEEIEPNVSDPMAKATQPLAVAKADPAEEPLEPSPVFQGFRVRPPNHLSPIAKAPRESFATRTAPASSSR